MPDNKFVFQCKNDEEVLICADSCGEEITVLTKDCKKIGVFSFRCIEEESHEYLYLTHMHLDGMSGKYLKQGIGRKCLQIARELSGMEIYAAENDGKFREDGSYLTEGAAIFVESMKKEGLIAGQI